MKKILSIVVILLVIASVFAMPLMQLGHSTLATERACAIGAEWTKYVGNPVIASPYFDQPSVIYEQNTYKMWISAIGGQGQPLKIYYATSNDGIAWTTPELVLDAGTSGDWDDYCVRAPQVLHMGTRYLMWYLASRSDGLYGIGLALSSDGVTWTRCSANPVMSPGNNGGWDDWALSRFAIAFDGTQYRMWYGAQQVNGGTVRIGAAASNNGISWTKYSDNPVLNIGDGWDSQHVIPESVVLCNGIYRMWYTGRHDPLWSVGMAISADGFSWTKCDKNPVLSVGPPRSWDSIQIWSCFVLKKEGSLLMWYVTEGGIGLATSYPPQVNLFLHDGASLDDKSPTAPTAKYKDSPSIKFSGGNPWKEIGTWAAPSSLTAGNLEALGGLDVWLGLKNSDDQGTNFDLRAEVCRNGVLMASGETYLIKGVTRNPDKALKVTVSFGSFLSVNFDGSADTLSLKILTRIGTDGNGNFGGGHSSAVGLRLYFDAVSRPSMFTASIA
jgi:hypothetical protein